MVGKSKVSSLADRCTQLNSSVKIEHHCTHLTSSNAVDLIKRYDLVLDCSDNLATRYLVNDACAVCGPKPLVSGSALRLEGQMTVYLTNRIRTKEELASGIRLPPEARSPCFRCLYPIPPAADTVQGCSEAGVFGVVPGIIGTMQAAEAIKLITGIGTVHNGRLFILDMERNLTRTVTLRNPRPDCAACGEHANMNEESIPSMNYAEFCGAPDHDKAPSLNLQRFRNRITVHELDQWRKSNTPHLMIDLRPEVEVELCRLKPCLFFPLKILLRDSVISQIYEKLKENLEKFSKRPFPIVLLCHRGNKSRIGAFQLASALCSFRHRHSQTDLPLAGENVAGTEESDTSDFVVCDVAGGLAAWANEIDPEFPSY
ncbi:Adenylyltransferase and sulfurtransferase [Fasciola hepatica]|uniref:Adenylyltransferase and sulfurtransferase n=1 Tax=Fasciola hepatica TaxID=6192 RepID=A0A4E0RY47_FASHE|nr:Adenylyltransferase and sulfurtransferase [Fasciola hepatica]